MIALEDDGKDVLAIAQSALSETGDTFTIGCSRGTAQLTAGMALDEALHRADQRLYAKKRSLHVSRQSEAKDALIQVLAEQNENLAAHHSHVAELAGSRRVVSTWGLKRSSEHSSPPSSTISEKRRSPHRSSTSPGRSA